jgi:hypothetical protein
MCSATLIVKRSRMQQSLGRYDAQFIITIPHFSGQAFFLSTPLSISWTYHMDFRRFWIKHADFTTDCPKIHATLSLVSYWNTCNIILTERRDRVVDTPQYSGGSEFKSLPGDWLSWLWFFVIFLSLSSRMLGWDLKIRPSLPFKPFPIHHSLITLFIQRL